jgi:hypothetical protein
MSDELISKAEKGQIAKLDKIDSAFVMLFLVNTFHTEQTAAIPKELILAICWEESFFQNIKQVGGPAVGYGQLEVSGRRIANQHLTKNPGAGQGIFNGPAILASRNTSMQAMSHCLAGLYERLHESQPAALNGYAGVQARPKNRPIPGKWKACETALRTVLNADTFDPIAFEDALRLARPFDASGPVYNHIHNRLWPLVDVLQGLVNQVSVGFQGSQVTIVQDAMNRIQDADPLSGDSFPLLELDGLFGPKTNARVKEFQSKNSLVADGIVGPRTREAINRKAQAFA